MVASECKLIPIKCNVNTSLLSLPALLFRFGWGGYYYRRGKASSSNRSARAQRRTCPYILPALILQMRSGASRTTPPPRAHKSRSRQRFNLYHLVFAPTLLRMDWSANPYIIGTGSLKALLGSLWRFVIFLFIRLQQRGTGGDCPSGDTWGNLLILDMVSK